MVLPILCSWACNFIELRIKEFGDGRFLIHVFVYYNIVNTLYCDLCVTLLFFSYVGIRYREIQVVRESV